MRNAPTVPQDDPGAARSQTQDIDLVIEVGETSVAELISQLPKGYYRDLDVAVNAARHRSSFNLVHLASGVKLDLFVRGDEPFDREELARSRNVALASAPDRPIRIKSAEDTILRKLQWFRLGGEVSDRQWTDVLGVLANQQAALDFDYLGL